MAGRFALGSGGSSPSGALRLLSVVAGGVMGALSGGGAGVTSLVCACGVIAGCVGGGLSRCVHGGADGICVTLRSAAVGVCGGKAGGVGGS